MGCTLARPKPSRPIALCGHMHSGKSHAAEILVKRYGFKRISFADPLKAFANALGLDVYSSNKDSVDPYWHITPRTFMQRFGTEICREHLPTIIPELHHLWIQDLIRRVQADRNRHPFVIDDLRFEDEAEALRTTLHAIIVKVDGGTTTAHPSEACPIKPDHTLPHMFTEQDVTNIVESCAPYNPS